MELNIHELNKIVKFFGIYLNTSTESSSYGKYLPVIVSIDEHGTTEVTFYKELTKNLS